MDGPGQFRPWMWKWASDEEQLVYFLAVGSPEPDHRVDPAMYYRLDRRVMSHEQMPPFVASWNGALFTYFFSHCWIDFLRFGPDDPVEVRVDDATSRLVREFAAHRADPSSSL